jgi:DNA-binding NarL/FixJ family response regulator
MPATAATVFPAQQYKRPRRLALLAPGGHAIRPVRVAIAERQTLVRAGFRLLLESDPGITVVGEAATGEDAVALVRTARPDVVVLDVHLPGLAHVRATQEILAEGVEIMLLATSEGDDSVLPSVRAGAGGVLLRDTCPMELVNAVRALAGGATVLSPTVERRLRADRPAAGRHANVFDIATRGVRGAFTGSPLAATPGLCG